MKTLRIQLPLFILGISLCSSPLFGETVKVETNKGITAKQAADYIHAAIEAGRTTYGQKIVERLHNKISLKSSENWEHENTLPLPAQFLLLSSEVSNTSGIGMEYRLASLWPINPKNGPRTEMEELGLKNVAENPEDPFTVVTQGHNGKWYFRAIYPDRAVTEACIRCHNNHPKSAKTDMKLGDVIGGIIITIPLRRDFKDHTGETLHIAPEVVADYVHSVIRSDRTVYSKHIVNRLGKTINLAADENWGEKNTLMLPAQFLKHTANLIREKKLGLDFRLISFWPINDRNRPANEFEHVGMDAVEIHPIRPYTGWIKSGRKKYFQAIYSDLAVTQACVDCHNNHPQSPKKDFALFDVMGGIVVTLPLN